MNLEDARLCVECEWLYSESSRCTRCGSRVSYPVARRMNGASDRRRFGRRRARPMAAEGVIWNLAV